MTAKFFVKPVDTLMQIRGQRVLGLGALRCPLRTVLSQALVEGWVGLAGGLQRCLRLVRDEFVVAILVQFCLLGPRGGGG
ncbi:hypothetical protein LAUMK35_01557 [Mycobacterium pseudokansasii]|nr:hypothetical protein LAUMK35_01557 [Mycobacterium pseudokansasii]VAZ92230.1 hypothetical protein LAUMK21_01556 [Mycobacterium pseudokansasii]